MADCFQDFMSFFFLNSLVTMKNPLYLTSLRVKQTVVQIYNEIIYLFFVLI